MTAWSHSLKEVISLPKETFFNLPEQKRQTIIDAALTEFGLHNYDKASINRIVATSGISKGSLYQYFDGKRDLYLYLIELMAAVKMKYITPVMKNPLAHSFFDVIHDMNREGLRFSLEHPEYMAIGDRLLQDRSHSIYQQIMKKNQELPSQAYETLLRLGIERGEIRGDLDVPFTAHMIFAMSSEIISSCLSKPSQTWAQDSANMLDQFMGLLARGIQNPAENSFA